MKKHVFAPLFVCLALAACLAAKDLAQIGSQAISDKDWERALEASSKGAGHALSPQEKNALLQSMLRQRLLVAEAKARKWDREEAFKAELAELERQRLAERLYQEEVTLKAQPGPEEASQAFEKEPRSFDRAQISQIVVAIEPGQEAAAEAKARSLAKELGRAPKGFAAKAKAISADKLSGPRGGDLGELFPMQLMPALAQAVFQAKKPGLVGPVKTDYGWHLIQIKKIVRSAWPRDAERIKDQIRVVRVQKLEAALMDTLAKKHKIVMKTEKP